MRKRYAIGAAISIAIFAVLNAIVPREICDDCDLHRGLPVHFWHQGGFLHDSGFLWGGLLANVLVILAAAMFFAYLVGWYELRR